MPKLHPTEAGYTLVEVLVAAAVFAVVFTMVAVLFARTTGEYSGWQYVTATQLAQKAMEEALTYNITGSEVWAIHANGVMWEVHQEIEETTAGLRSIRITITRHNSDQTYATIWTQVYHPRPEGF